MNLPAQILTVSSEGSKNRYRQRTIPLREPQTLWAMEHLIKRAWELGSRDPDHYIFPFVLGHNPVPHRPMSVQGLKKPWQEVRQATGLLQFRMYDTRHTAITRLAENGVPVTVIMDLAGHISPRMTQHYTHVSEQAKVIAMRQASQGRYGWTDPRPGSPVPSLPFSMTTRLSWTAASSARAQAATSSVLSPVCRRPQIPLARSHREPGQRSQRSEDLSGPGEAHRPVGAGHQRIPPAPKTLVAQALAEFGSLTCPAHRSLNRAELGRWPAVAQR